MATRDAPAVGEAGNGEPDHVVFARITEEDLDLNLHLEAVAGAGFGAVVNFIGRIRDHDADARGRVERLEYSAHPDAGSILERIAEEVARPGTRLAVSHRIGPVEVGRSALIACVAAAHRAEAYEVSRELIERIKVELPIWKKQVTTEGDHNWQGLG